MKPFYKSRLGQSVSILTLLALQEFLTSFLEFLDAGDFSLVSVAKISVKGVVVLLGARIALLRIEDEKQFDART